MMRVADVATLLAEALETTTDPDAGSPPASG
jgi:hypothetical protein